MRDLVIILNSIFKKAGRTMPIFTDETVMHITYGFCLRTKTIHMFAVPEDAYLIKDNQDGYEVTQEYINSDTNIQTFVLHFKNDTYAVIIYPLASIGNEEDVFNDEGILVENGHPLVQRMILKAVQEPTASTVYYAISAVSILENWMTDIEWRLLNYLLYECTEVKKFVTVELKHILQNVYQFHQQALPAWVTFISETGAMI